VFPTCVGMNRGKSHYEEVQMRVPHMRGDGCSSAGTPYPDTGLCILSLLYPDIPAPHQFKETPGARLRIAHRVMGALTLAREESAIEVIER